MADSENEEHEELLRGVMLGKAAILSDEHVAGGRFQVAAVVMGGEFILTQWHQDASGDWRSKQCLWLKRDAATRLVGLLHSAGYAGPLAPVKS